MSLRLAMPADIPFIMQTERLPGYEATVGQWDAERHAHEMAAPSNRYFIFDDDGAPAAFAILQGIDDGEGNIYLKRIAVTRQGAGIGKSAIGALQDWVFRSLPSAHRLYLHYSARNARGHRLYQWAGFVNEGADREAFVATDGARVDRVRVSILRREWAALRS